MPGTGRAAGPPAGAEGALDHIEVNSAVTVRAGLHVVWAVSELWWLLGAVGDVAGCPP